jgi:hypothetical protein
VRAPILGDDSGRGAQNAHLGQQEISCLLERLWVPFGTATAASRLHWMAEQLTADE